MKITKIAPQQKRADRVSVYIDGAYSFSLLKEQLGELNLKVGDEVTSTDVDNFKAASDTGKLFARVLQQLARRPRSRWEVRDYLQRKGANDMQVQDVLDKLDHYNYLNDRDFAESWVSSRRALKPTSHKKLRFELRKKRVPVEIIDAVLEEDESSDVQQLKDLIVKKRRQTRYQDQQKLMEYCARQGFRYGDIRQALEELENDG